MPSGKAERNIKDYVTEVYQTKEQQFAECGIW